MEQNTADPAEMLGPAVMDLPQWKTICSGICAILLAILFFVSGSWKIADPFQWAQAMTQFRVPGDIALPFAIAVGIGEAFSAALILVPNLRRWGSFLIILMLLGFMAYIGLNYNV